MVLVLLGISLFMYMAVVNTSWAGAIVVWVFVLPLALYHDYNRECTLKEIFFTRRRRKK